MLILRVLSMVCRSPDDGVAGGGGGGGADAGAGGGGENRSEAGLLAALQAERKAGQDLKAQLAKIESDRKAADEAAATKAGEYQKLYDPLKAEHEKLTAELEGHRKANAERTERVKARNDARIKALPEPAAKALAPLAASLAPEALADWMDEHLSALVAEAGTTRPAGTVAGGGKKVEEPIPAACTQEWERYGRATGVTERDWYENNWLKRHPKKG
jgi:type II secretory pathway component HofQ